MKKILLFLFLLNCFYGLAQNDETFVDSQVAQIMAQLEMQENPEYFSRKDYCIENVQMFVMPDGSRCSSASTYYSVYVFWKEDDKLKIQKFDNCGSFVPLLLNNEKLMKKVSKMKTALKTEEVKPYANETQVTHPTANMSPQSCRKEYIFKLQGETFEKSFSELDLSEGSENKNLNAKHNNSLLLIDLDKEISSIISEFEMKGKFYREK